MGFSGVADNTQEKAQILIVKHLARPTHRNDFARKSKNTLSTRHNSFRKWSVPSPNAVGFAGFGTDSIQALKIPKIPLFPLFSGKEGLYRPAPKGANTKLLFKQYSNIGGGRDSPYLPNKHCARYSFAVRFFYFHS